MGKRRSRQLAQLYTDNAQAQVEPGGGGGPSEEDAMRSDEPVVLRRVEKTYTYTRRSRRGMPSTRLAPEIHKTVAPESPMEQQPEEPPAAESVEQQPLDGVGEEPRVQPAPVLQASRHGRGTPRRFRSLESGKELAAESALEQQPEEMPADGSVQQREEEAAKAKRTDEEEQGRRLEMPPLTRRRKNEEGLWAAEAMKKQKRQESVPAVEAEPVEKQRWEDDDVAEDVAAVPIGKPVMVTGQGKRKHYTSFKHNGRTFNLADMVLITPETKTEKPYIAIIKGTTEIEGSLTITVQWFYRPEEAEIGEGTFYVARHTRELFYSFHIDDVPAESVMHKCVVHFIPQNKQIPTWKEHPGFVVQKVYGATEKKLWNLTDKVYEENIQQEIDILLKRTMNRIGDLHDVEPLNEAANVVNVASEPRAGKPDVTSEPRDGKPNNVGKTEAPATPKPKNYAILARYNAITGVETRDMWLDKLLESIPLAWSKEISARMIRVEPVPTSKSPCNVSSTKVTAYVDNDKSYGFSDVVPIIASLEKAAYEALGSDSQQYNQKMEQLLYNIKHSSKLRWRLMEKELRPQVLLTMSPGELKAGLTSAEKTFELEQKRHLQMIDARCQRCQEKKVRKSYNTDHDQLECTSCGHTWSYEAVSLAANSPCNATVTRNTAAGTAASHVAPLEKKQQQAKSRNRLACSETKGRKLGAIPEDHSA